MKFAKLCTIFLVICHSLTLAATPVSRGINTYALPFSRQVAGNLFAASLDLSSNAVSVYHIDILTGLFTEISGSPFTAGTGISEVMVPTSAEVNFFGASVNLVSNTISVYKVNESSGHFAEVQGSPFAVAGAPDGVSFSPIAADNLFAVVGSFLANNTFLFQVALLPYSSYLADFGASEGGSPAEFSSKLPTISSLVPPGGPTAGGITVMIVGKHFTGATSVKFGDFPATSFTVVNDTLIRAVVPFAGQIMNVEVVVTAPLGDSPTTDNCLFAFLEHYLFITPEIK